MRNQSNRRKFPRLALSEEARVYDENGRELGVVSEVSGNGMNIEPASIEVTESLPAGQRVRITIMESGSRATTVLDVVIRRQSAGKLGMEFVDD